MATGTYECARWATVSGISIDTRSVAIARKRYSSAILLLYYMCLSTVVSSACVNCCVVIPRPYVRPADDKIKRALLLLLLLYSALSGASEERDEDSFCRSENQICSFFETANLTLPD